MDRHLIVAWFSANVRSRGGHKRQTYYYLLPVSSSQYTRDMPAMIKTADVPLVMSSNENLCRE